MSRLTRATVPLAALLTLALALGLGLSGCGDRSNRPSDADRAAIEKTVNRAFSSDDPAICTEIATPRLIAVLYRGSLQACRRQTAAGTKARHVDTSEIKVDGDDAAAKARVLTSRGAVQRLTVGLKRRHGRWKLDLIGA